LNFFPALGLSVHDGFREVTLQQLLGHRAGLAQYRTPKSLRSAGRRVDNAGSPRAQRRAFATWLLRQAPDAATNIDHYSNAGYPIAAAMAEAAADEPWESLLESRLARSLDITLWRGQPARIDSAQSWWHGPKGAFRPSGQPSAVPNRSWMRGAQLVTRRQQPVLLKLYFWSHDSFWEVAVDTSGLQPIVGTQRRLFNAEEAGLHPGRIYGIRTDGRFLTRKNPDDFRPPLNFRFGQCRARLASRATAG
jgi:CubicO group peptidase (beta-lactamase class C family)